MKKISLLLLLFINVTAIQAQEKKIYLTGSFSKDFSSGSQVLGTKINGGSMEVVTGTYGRGSSFGPGIGYMFSNNIGAELNFSFFSVAEVDFSSAPNSDLVNGSMKRITTAIKFTTGDNFKPYAKFGFVYGIKPRLDNIIKQSFTYTTSFTLSEGSTTGFMGALGFDLNLSRVTGIFLESRMINQTWAPKILEHKASGNGVHVNKKYDLVDKAALGTTSELLKNYHSFSSMGINLGFKFTLGNKISAAAEKK